MYKTKGIKQVKQKYKKLVSMLLDDNFSDWLEFQKKSGNISDFSEIFSLIGVPQSTENHPEGDVFTHTCLALKETLKFRHFLNTEKDQMTLVFAVLCHDFGKPFTTSINKNKFTSYQHHIVSTIILKLFLEKCELESFYPFVKPLVKEHSCPSQLFKNRESISKKALISLSERVDIKMLCLVNSCDYFGRNIIHSETFSPASLWLIEQLNINF